MLRFAERIIARWVLARFIANAPITEPYLGKLVEYMRQQDLQETSEWRGMWGQAIALVQRWQRQLKAGDTYEAPKTVGELFEAITARDILDPVLVSQLKEAVGMPRATRPKALSFHDALRTLEQASGKSVVFDQRLAGKPNAAEQVVAIAGAIKKLKPAAQRVFQSVVKKIKLADRPRGTEGGSWEVNETLRLVVRAQSEHIWSYIITHELGHGLEEQRESEFAAGPWGQPPFISDYAESKPDYEDVAESFTEYVLSPATLKSKCPDKYTALKALGV